MNMRQKCKFSFQPSRIYFLAFFASCMLTRQIYGVETQNRSQPAFKLGLMSGTISSSSANSGNIKKFGGLNLSLSYITDTSDSWSRFIEPQVVVDLVSLSALRMGLSMGLHWHFLGGPLLIKRSSVVADQEFRSKYNMSLIIRGGFYSYSARDPLGLSEPVLGSVLESFLGFAFGASLSKASRYGIEMGTSLINFSTSVEDVKSSIMEVNFFYRLGF